MKKAIIFARVSTKRQEKEGLSINEIQLPKAYEYAKRNGIEVVKEFAIGETGGSYKIRGKFKEMLDYAIKHKDVTDIISFRVDRITRNFQDAVLIDDLRIKHNKTIHFINDNLILHRDSRSNDILQWDMKVLIARQYLERVREDGSNTKYTKLERGELPWGAPFGYKHHQIDNKRKTVISTQPKAQVVREIHIRYSTGAYSCRLLAREISQEYDIRLTTSMVNRILRDKFYIGIMTDKKTGKEYPHFYEHLVSDEIFERNQAILDGNYNNRKIRYAGLPSVYRGLIRCSLCGCIITPEKKRKVQKNGNTHEYYYYHCTNAKRMHSSPVKYITENKLNEYVMGILKDFRMSEEKLTELQKALNDAHENKIDFYESKRKEIIAKRKQLSNRKRNMYDLLADKCITPDEYNQNNARYDEELSNLRRLEERLDNADNNFYISVGYLLSIFQHAEKIFEVANISEKRQIVSLILSNLQLDDEKLIFNLKEPFDKLVNLSKGSYGWG